MSPIPVAIVTAASQGIGAACARELSLRGYQLVVMSRSDNIVKIAGELNADYLKGSVTNPDDLASLVNMAMERHGRIDAVVNNSGHPPGGELNSLPDSLWQDVFDSVLMSVIRMARLVTPAMVQQRQGAIVNISGSDAYEPDLRFPVCSAMRASLGAYTKLYARQYGQYGIRMNCVCPSVVFDYDTAAIREDIKREVPLQRPANYTEIAKVVAFLLSQDASFVTGENMRVDGGAARGV